MAEITIDTLAVNIEDDMEAERFVDELEELLKGFAQNGNDYFFTWRLEEPHTTHKVSGHYRKG